MSEIIVEGHRGYRSEYPENTLVSFCKAIELGVDAIEFDVWLSSDGVPVIMHDGNAWRTTGCNRHINDMTLAEIKELDAGTLFDEKFTGEKVPTLREVLELVSVLNHSCRLGVEIKDYREETVDKTISLLKEFEFFDDCWFYCFNARIIKYIKTKYNGRTMGYPDFQMSEFEPDSYSYYDELGISMKIVKSEIFEFYKNKNFLMHFFCADTTEDVELCIKKGASLITANNPVPLMRCLKRL